MSKNVGLFNAFVGLFSQIIILVMGLVVPRIILINYGSDVNGLTSTISQIFIYMALLEMGISQATRNALYKPVYENNRESISKCLNISRKYYRKISLYYFGAVLFMASILPLIMKTKIEFTTIFVYILFEGMTSVVSFYFINTCTCFLSVSGKTYVVNLFALFGKVAGYFVKICLAVLAINIMYIQVGFFVISLVQLIMYKKYMKKNYSWIDYKKDVTGESLPDKKSYFVSEIAWTIFSSTDMIVLSIFVSTSLSSVYSVYNMVFISLTGLLNSVYSSISYKLGQSYSKSLEEYKSFHDCIHAMFVSLIVVLMSVCYLLIIPFIRLYTAGVDDIEYVYYALPFLFCFIQIVSWTRIVPANVTGIAGYAKEVSRVSIIEAVMNVLLSVILVTKCGIIGVLLATALSVPIKVFYCNYLAEKRIMSRSSKSTLRMIFTNYLIFALTVLFERKVTFSIDNYTHFFLWSIVLIVIYCFISVVVNWTFNRNSFYLLRKIFKK